MERMQMSFTTAPGRLRRPLTKKVGGSLSLPLVAVFLFGFSLQFNALSSTWGLPFLRVSDAFVFLTIAVLILAVRRSEVPALALLVAGCAAIMLPALLFKSAVQDGDNYFTFMIFASLVLAICMQAFDCGFDRIAAWLCYGVLFGMAASLFVLVLRSSGIDLTSLGLGTPQSTLVRFDLSVVKPGGIWVHGNEAGHVYAFAGAFALYLSFRAKNPLIYTIYYVMFLISFSITLNRGGLIAPTVGLVAAFGIAGRGDVLAKATVGLLGAACLYVAVVQLPGLEGLREALERRLGADSYFGQNLSERLNTFLGGLKVAFNYPFGIGYAERAREVAYASGVPTGTPHNGIISLSYQAGLAFAALYSVSSVFVLTRFSSFRSLPFLVAAFSVPSLLFEELTINPNFHFAIAFTVSAFLMHVFGSQGSGRR